VWLAIKFIHVLLAISWVGIQLTLFGLFPVLRRRLEPDEFRVVARAAGLRLAAVAAVALPGLLITGIALAQHDVPDGEKGWVTAKILIWGGVVGLLAFHGATAARSRRVWASGLMLVLSLGAVLVGVKLTEG
jgi:uncharacterized membrane protein